MARLPSVYLEEGRMELSERLMTIALMVPHTDTVADIGCDHGKLAVWLIEHGVARQVICGDISEKSLDKAKRLAASEGLQQRISFRVGSGFSILSEDEAHIAIISGMGGELIVSIIAADIAKAPETLVLASHTSADILRGWLTENGYYIEDEKLVNEKGHFYPVMRFRRGVMPSLSQIERELGPVLLQKKPEALRLLIKQRIQKTIAIRAQLQQSGSLRKEQLLQEYDAKLKKYKEVQKCL